MVPKIEEIKHYLSTHDIDVINIQESWINKYTPVVKGYKLLQTTLSERRGTGIITYIKQNIRHTLIKVVDWTKKGLEGIFFKLYTSNSSLSFGNIYIHPDSKSDAIDILGCLMDELPRIDVLTGDFNAHCGDWSSKHNRNKIVQLSYK